MKGVLVVIDGLGDLPCKELDGKTPLEAAEKPNLDYLAKKGKLGYMFPVKEGIAPESDSAIMSLLGNKFMSSYRGYFEALGSGIEIRKGDLALRTNFATIDNLQNKKVIDRRAGRTLTTKEAEILASDINAKVKLPCKFIFKNTIQHRGALVLKGGFSDNISNTDSAYHTPGKVKLNERFKFSEPLDEEENTKFTANVLNEFIEQSYKILNGHPVNEARKKKNLMPANIILTRDASTSPAGIKKFPGWAAIVYMPLEIGIAKESEMRIFSFPYPELKKYKAYANLFEGLEKACKYSAKTLKEQGRYYSYFYIHFKETDVPGHDNKPEEKKRMLEMIDEKFFLFLRRFAEKNKIEVLVTGDHSTPCRLKSHSADPVPVLLCDWTDDNEKKFCEKSARKGKLGKMYGREILKLLD